MVGCSYDDSAILDKITELEKEQEEMQAQIDVQQALLNALANNLTITAVTPNDNGYTITFSDGSSITIKNGEQGENSGQGNSFIESIEVGEEDVTFTLTDGTVIVIPFNQEQNDAIIAGKTKFNLDGWGTSISIEWESNVACEVIIPDEAKWISFAPETRALISNKVNLEIASNENSAERSATVKVVAVNNSDSFAEYTITQTTVYCIRYKTTDGNAVTPYTTAGFGANIISNNYERGNGVIEFDAPIAAIGERVFRSCSTLSSFTIPDSVTLIGESAFSGCSSLTSITIPDGVTEIGQSTFSGCSSLTSITIPDSVTSIGNNAFRNCSSLPSITIPDSVTSIRDKAFYGCSSLTSVTIGNGVTSIGDGAFYRCYSLTSVTIPDSVTEIGNYAFESCTSLTRATIGNGVTSIGEEAFCGCTSLTSITIPDSVTSIGERAFSGCSSLTKVYCKPTTPPSGNSNMFYDNAEDRKIYVPRSSVNAYKKAEYWSEYADSIEGYYF